jgi:hypothetical protein
MNLIKPKAGVRPELLFNKPASGVFQGDQEIGKICQSMCTFSFFSANQKHITTYENLKINKPCFENAYLG